MSKNQPITKRKRHFEAELGLMFITILVVAGFQLYWLRFNYQREQSSLVQRANFGFRETVMKMQAEGFDFRHFIDDSVKDINIDISSTANEAVKIRMISPEDVSELVTAVGKKVEDTLKKINRVNSTMVISADKKLRAKKDSSRVFSFVTNRRKEGEGFLRFLYRVDSLRDTLRLSALDSAFTVFLQREKISVPFTILKTKADSADIERFDVEGPPFEPGHPVRVKNISMNSKVTTGFVNPVTYELKLGNIFPFVIKKITLPLLFSVFLIGLTIISLVFLYRNLQKQRRLTLLKNDFISNVTHELKTPIATVGVAIEALKNFNAINDPERTREYLDISQNELNRLSMLVDKVLKLSMFENHELVLKKEKFDLATIVREVTGSFQLQFEKKQAQCVVEKQGDDFSLFADKMHITSVIYNLVDNALKYSPEKPVITIGLKDNAGDVGLSVSDNGIGIPPEYRTRIFDKFFRVPAGDTHNVKGYGLGLSYVAQVIEKHGGTVTVESEKEKGSTFKINLPRSNG